MGNLRMAATDDLDGREHTMATPPSRLAPSHPRAPLQDYHQQLMILQRHNEDRLRLAFEEKHNMGRLAERSSTPLQVGMPPAEMSPYSCDKPLPESAEQVLDDTSELAGPQFQRPDCERATTSEGGTGNHDKRLSSSPQRPKPVPISRIDPNEGAFVQESPSCLVQVQPPWDQHPPEASSVPVEDHASQRSSMWSPASLRRQSVEEPPEGLSMRSQPLPEAVLSADSSAVVVGLSDQVAASHSRNNSMSDVSRRLLVPPLIQSPGSGRVAGSTAAEVGSHSPSQNHQHPHHRTIEDQAAKSVDNRASRIAMRSTHSDASLNSDPNARNDYLAPANMRSPLGGTLPRPDSVHSSVSDLACGRNRSPGRSSSGYARASSTYSPAPSPDQRPLSYVDLLNVPYPQAPPVSADRLDNTHLRTAVGNNASLLSTRRTLEMYRANVKKSSDLATQYEFAVFMISAAQEVAPEPSKGSPSASTSGGPRSDLLKEARQILQRLSDRSYPFAQYYLADGYASGLFNKGKEDYEKAFPLFVSASKHGHAEAGYRTALCYEFGWGCRMDGAKATQFFRHAASKNHPGAMLRLGRACLVGDMGLAKRYREGVTWLKRAAETADFQYNSAPYELGLLHESGYGDDIFRDESYAAQLFTKSADLGHAEANYRLGTAYEHGTLGCPQDAALSVHFYTGAAQQFHPLAMMALCAWYMVGAEPVLDRDENEAYEWAHKAAEAGFARAEYTVAFFTETGIGCRRDALEANVWYVRAADQGHEKAIHRIAAIRAAATGADPVTAALPKGDDGTSPQAKRQSGSERGHGKAKSKKFGIF